MMKVGGKCLFVLVVSSSVYEPWKKLAKSDKWGKYLTHHFVSPYYGLTHPIAKMENHLKTAGFSQFEAILNDDNDFYEDVNGVKGTFLFLSNNFSIQKLLLQILSNPSHVVLWCQKR